MSQLPVWGIDVTATSLRAVRLSLGENGRPQADAWDVIDFAEDVEDPRGVGRYDAMTRAVRRFVKHQDVRNARVMASIRGETAFVRTVVVPQVQDETWEKILVYEAQQQIPFPLEEVYWDRRVSALKDGEAVVSLYAIRRQQVDDRLRRLGMMGLPVDGLQLRPLALQNFCSAEKLFDEGAVVVDYDFSGMQILIAHDDRTWFRCLPIGGADFVEKLAARLKIPHAVAVRMAAGHVAPRPAHGASFAELQESVARDAANEVAAQVRAYVAAHPEARLTRLILFSPHAACPPIADALEKATRLTPFVPRGFKSIDVASDVVGAGLQENFAGLARAAGLALQGLGKADMAVRLFPESIPRVFRRRRVGYAAAAALVLGSMLIAGGRLGDLRSSMGAASTEIESRIIAAEQSSRARFEKRVSEDDPTPPLQSKWAARVQGREGRLPFYAGLLESLATSSGSKLVAFETGEAPGVVAKPTSGRLVLARLDVGDSAATDAAMDADVGALVGKNGLKSAIPTDSWSDGSLQSKKPPVADERLLRARFRHRVYELAFEDAR